MKQSQRILALLAVMIFAPGSYHYPSSSYAAKELMSADSLRPSASSNELMSADSLRSTASPGDLFSEDRSPKPGFDSIVQDEGSWNLESQESSICKAAEPEGMDTYKECSRDCKTVCSFKKKVSDVNCFSCQQGGDDTCADIGQLDAPHPWCEPGGPCYDDAMLFCSAPFDAVGPRRSKLKCTNCKKRPDMCWQKVKDGTTTLTNCKLGCWNGTCEYVGKYIEKEWDGKDEFIHCYECVTPPPPPTCEELKWGYDWESACLNICAAPNQCQEFLMTMGGPNNCCDPQAAAAANAGKDDKKGGGTKAPRDQPGGPGSKPKPPKGGPSKIGGEGAPTDSGETKERKKDPCEEVANSFRSAAEEEELHPLDLEKRKKNMERFQKSVAALKEKAEKVEGHLAPMRQNVESLGRQLNEAEAELKTAQTEAQGAENLGSYGTQKLETLKKAEAKAQQLRSHYSQAKTGLDRQVASFGKDIDTLKQQAQKDLYQADPQAKQLEELGRLDQSYEAWRDLSYLQQRQEISDKVFSEKAAELQKKIDAGGPQAEDYQRQLDNLNRGKKEWDESQSKREEFLKKDINRLQKDNGEAGVGPYDERGLLEGVGNAAQWVNGQISKLKDAKRNLQKAVENNCPPKEAAQMIKEIDAKIKDLEAVMKNFEDRYAEIDSGYPLAEDHKQEIANSIAGIAEGSKRTDQAKSFARNYLESQVEEIERTFDPTDPRVGLKKAFWYSVGVVEGVGKAIKGLVDLGVGALDLIGETAAKYAGYEDGGIFGTDASAALQNVMGGLDGNMNLDGLEKLAQGIDKAISSYVKKLSRSNDMDKDLSRVSGQFVGEALVGDKLIGKAAKGVGLIDEATTASRGLKAGEGASHAPPKLPDIDVTPPKLADTPPGTTPGSTLGGKADDLAKVPDTSAHGPRAPPQSATDFKGNSLPDKDGVTPKPLPDDVAKSLETQNGFRADHANNMHEFAQKKGVYLIVRDGNPDSVKFMNDPNKMPKPMSSKAKTAKAGPPENKGLVVDPTHPQQVKYWDDDIAAAKKAGDKDLVDYLEYNRNKAVKEWAKEGENMKSKGYSVNKETGVIEYTDPVTGKHFDGVHGDYDLHGVFEPGQSRAPPSKVSFGSGQKFDSNGVDVEGGTLRSQINDAIDPNKKYVQHGGQDDWVPDPKKVPNKGPDPPATVFMPDGTTPVRLETAEDMKKFYEETMGVKWEYQ